MTISRQEDWVQLAELDEHDQIRFTEEFRALMGDLGWEAKAFVGHLLGANERLVRAQRETQACGDNGEGGFSDARPAAIARVQQLFGL